MKMKKVYFLVLFLAQCNAFGQLAGFCGKRFTIEYSNYMFPALIGPMASYNGPGLNMTHCGDLSFVVSKKIAAEISLQYSKTGFHEGSSTQLLYEEDYNTWGITYSPKFGRPMNLTSRNIGFGIKLFGPGYLAPLGNYFKPELLILSETVTYDPHGFKVVDYYDNSYTDMSTRAVGKGTYSHKAFAITATFGRQRIFMNRLVLDYGVRVGFTPVGIVSWMNNSDMQYESNELETELRRESNMRMFRSQLLNFHLGIGFLAF